MSGDREEQLREELEYELGKATRPGSEALFSFIEWFIEQGGNNVGPRTLDRYRATYNHLRNFAKARRVKVDFGTIDQELYNELLDYLTNDLNQAVNTTGVYIKNLKVFLRAAYDKETTESRIFEKKWFKVPSEETTHIYLTGKEIETL